MAPKPNLADPDFEPTDEQLIELSKRAFADVAKKHEAASKRLRQEIAEGRARVRNRMRALAVEKTAK